MNMNADILQIIERRKILFDDAFEKFSDDIHQKLTGASILVVGAAGSIGAAVSAQLYNYELNALHLVDISENNLVETMRNLRSLAHSTPCDLRSFVADICSPEFSKLVNHYGPYDYVLNLSAMKHVRSERDPYSLMRLILTNLLAPIQLNELCARMNVKKHFCVSTDKAADPINAMGCSKRAMEILLLSQKLENPISFSRFANVAFSDGSLLHGFVNRLKLMQPLSVPSNIYRYFITPEEAGRLCILSLLFAQHKEIFIPDNPKLLTPISFEKIAKNFLSLHGYEPHVCATEAEAKTYLAGKSHSRHWPLYLFKSDTSGEKTIEKFSADREVPCNSKFTDISIIKIENEHLSNVYDFKEKLKVLRNNPSLHLEDLIDLLHWVVPEFSHVDKKKSLDERM